MKTKSSKKITRFDPANPPIERTLLGGAEYHANKADCLATFRKYNWVPPSQQKNLGA